MGRPGSIDVPLDDVAPGEPEHARPHAEVPRVIDLTGKTALVTGGSRGIGRAIALRLATQGADVAFSYRGNEAAAEETHRRVEALGRQALAIQADATDPEAAEGVVKAGRRGVRQGRHPRQQRRDHPRRPDHADERRGVPRGPRDEPVRGVLHDQGRHPADAQGEGRPDHQHHLGQRPGRPDGPGELLVGEGRPDRPDEGDGPRARLALDHLQRRRAGLRPDRADPGPARGAPGRDHGARRRSAGSARPTRSRTPSRSSSATRPRSSPARCSPSTAAS